MTKPRLVVFDVDGTLVDSQAHILAAMTQAFSAIGRTPPERDDVLAIVGLSLPQAMARLAPDALDQIDTLVDAYKTAFAELRGSGSGDALSPLFPGARACLDALSSDPWVFLGIATGKSRRGLDHILDLHDLRGMFHTVQVADDHPSKPHPSMLEACLRDTGVDAVDAIMVGDTSFDIAMGRVAGMRTVAVSWGYHPITELRAAGADAVIDDFATLPSLMSEGLQTP